jgi:hypothetical protein
MTFYRALAVRCRETARRLGNPVGSVFCLIIRVRSLNRLSWTILSPFERNATAKQGYERRSPIAYNLLPGACILTHAFAY